ncbi:MAG: DUF4184 family protein [Candidatus Thorarchaeota archaeon]|jgi:hypothetical protein
MPFTLFHYPIGYWLSKTNKRFILPALLVGSVLPDIEVPLLYFLFSDVVTDHFILHSLIGALTIGLVLAVIVTRYVYPPLISRVFRLDQQELVDLCRVSPNLVLSCAVGLVFHLLLDYPIHWYNHLLWPWIEPTLLVGPLAQFMALFLGTDVFTGYVVSGALSGIVLGTVLILIILRNREDLWRSIWIGF